MIDAGMNVARLNFSWGSHDEHRALIVAIREAAKNRGVRIPIIQDLSGPRVQGKHGHSFDHHFGSHSGPHGVLTDKDLQDLNFGAIQKIDYVAMSFVGNEKDIIFLRKEMKARGYKAPIIAKIEREEALHNLDAIIKETDAVMVARGDLGNEVPLEQIPFIQLGIIRKAKKAKKSVITATQMMLTMTENPLPTRAEVTDVAYAVLDGSDAVMLSEESAQGKYPVEVVDMMRKIVIEAEGHMRETAFHLL
jgi:pyruvate kinase